MDQPNVTKQQREPWNKGKLVGQKAPFKLKNLPAVPLLTPGDIGREKSRSDTREQLNRLGG